MEAKFTNLQQSLEQELLAIDKTWDAHLEEIDKSKCLSSEQKALNATLCLKEKAKQAAPYRKALAQLKKIKT